MKHGITAKELFLQMYRRWKDVHAREEGRRLVAKEANLRTLNTTQPVPLDLHPWVYGLRTARRRGALMHDGLMAEGIMWSLYAGNPSVGEREAAKALVGPMVARFKASHEAYMKDVDEDLRDDNIHAEFKLCLNRIGLLWCKVFTEMEPIGDALEFSSAGVYIPEIDGPRRPE